MSTLNQCPHCGFSADYFMEGERIFAGCTNAQVCGIRTPSFAAGVDYAAKERAAAVWNNAAPDAWPAWVRPTGAHDAYEKDAKVSHLGKRWVSLAEANVWEPGVSAWREVV